MIYISGGGEGVSEVSLSGQEISLGGRQLYVFVSLSGGHGHLLFPFQASRSTQRMMFAPPKLTVHGVFAKLKEIAFMSGTSVSLCIM